MNLTPQQSNPESCRTAAREHARRGEPLRAEEQFERLLETHPRDLEALQFLANRHHQRGNFEQALSLLALAADADPEVPAIELQRGAVELSMGNFRAAAVSIEHGLQKAPGAFVARLRLGIALEQVGEHDKALRTYFRAINAAQQQGRWLDDATTAPSLRGPVQYAINYVQQGRSRLFHAALDPLRERYGTDALVRVEESLAVYLGLREAGIPDSRQRPTFFYFKGIPSQPFYPRHRFPWADKLDQATHAVRDELDALLRQNLELEAFLGSRDRAATANLLQGSRGREPVWDAFFFYRHGKRHDENCERCPATAGLLDSLPLVKVRDHAPETLFSVLKPGTHILPHRGVTNTRLVTHLPLIIPADCALRVGGEIHAWQAGRCVTFDDTFEHEAWNRSDETRVVLILDSWNPDLSEVERVAVTDLVETIGDFNEASESSPAWD